EKDICAQEYRKGQRARDDYCKVSQSWPPPVAAWPVGHLVAKNDQRYEVDDGSGERNTRDDSRRSPDRSKDESACKLEAGLTDQERRQGQESLFSLELAEQQRQGPCK